MEFFFVKKSGYRVGKIVCQTFMTNLSDELNQIQLPENVQYVLPEIV